MVRSLRQLWFRLFLSRQDRRKRRPSAAMALLDLRFRLSRSSIFSGTRQCDHLPMQKSSSVIMEDSVSLSSSMSVSLACLSCLNNSGFPWGSLSLRRIFSIQQSSSCARISSTKGLLLFLSLIQQKQMIMPDTQILLATGVAMGGRERQYYCTLLGLYLFDYSSVMQSSPPGNILRNSYGYQIVDPPPLRSPASKPYPFPPHYSLLNQQESNIKQLENKLEGFGVKKTTQQEVPYQPQQQLRDPPEGRFKGQYLFAHEEPLSEQQLRGSCQNIIRKFDYTALRNTTHFNPLNKPPSAPNELRRSPPQEDQHRNQNPNVNRTLAQEPSNTFLRPNEKKLLENKHSFLANNPSKSPPQITSDRHPEDKTLAGSRTPTKYKTLLDALEAKNAASKGNPEMEDKKLFKTLNEIVQSKQKEKTSPETKKSSCPKTTMINGFELGSVLGRGKFGQVFVGRHAETGFIAAIKKIEKAKVKEFKMLEQFVQEIRLHSSLDHPNIVKFYGVFEEGDSIYLVMELLNGGTLFDYLNEVNCIPLREAVEYLRDVIQALTYMHDKSIAHRDIKPENIVISSEGVAKLCDFGWSALVEKSRKTYCGTFDYAPPQILERKNYDTSIDIWCIGVLTYELLTGRVPFQGDKRNVVRDKIVNVDKHKIDYPPDFPQEAKEFIESLVQKDPALRPKCHQLLKFKLFTMHLGKGLKPKKLQ